MSESVESTLESFTEETGLQAPFACSAKINHVALALARAQGEMDYAEKDATNPAFSKGAGGGKYADLAAHFRASRKALTKFELAVTQLPRIADNGQLCMDSVLIHGPSGQWIACSLPVLTTANTMQAIGSGLTYARRYGYSPITGTAPSDDDDGNKAENDKDNVESKPFKVDPPKQVGGYKPRPVPPKREEAEVDRERSHHVAQAQVAPGSPVPAGCYDHANHGHNVEIARLLKAEGVTDRSTLAHLSQKCHGTPLGDLSETAASALARLRRGDVT